MAECPAAGPVGGRVGAAAVTGADRHCGPSAEAASLQGAPSESADSGGENAVRVIQRTQVTLFIFFTGSVVYHIPYACWTQALDSSRARTCGWGCILFSLLYHASHASQMCLFTTEPPSHAPKPHRGIFEISPHPPRVPLLFVSSLTVPFPFFMGVGVLPRISLEKPLVLHRHHAERCRHRRRRRRQWGSGRGRGDERSGGISIFYHQRCC